MVKSVSNSKILGNFQPRSRYYMPFSSKNEKPDLKTPNLTFLKESNVDSRKIQSLSDLVLPNYGFLSKSLTTSETDFKLPRPTNLKDNNAKVTSRSAQTTKQKPFSFKIPLISDLFAIRSRQKEELKGRIEVFTDWYKKIETLHWSKIGSIKPTEPAPETAIGLFWDVVGSTGAVTDGRIQEIMHLTLQANDIIEEAAQNCGIEYKLPRQTATDGSMVVCSLEILMAARKALINLFEHSKFPVIGGSISLKDQRLVMAFAEKGDAIFFGTADGNTPIHKAEKRAKETGQLFIDYLKNTLPIEFEDYLAKTTEVENPSPSMFEKNKEKLIEFLEKISRPLVLKKSTGLKTQKVNLYYTNPEILGSQMDSVIIDGKRYYHRPLKSPDWSTKRIIAQEDTSTGDYLNLKDPQQFDIFHKMLWESNRIPGVYTLLIPRKDGKPITPQDVQTLWNILEEVSMGHNLFVNESLLEDPLNKHLNLNPEIFNVAEDGIRVFESLALMLAVPYEVSELFRAKIEKALPHLKIKPQRGKEGVSFTVSEDKDHKPVSAVTDGIDANLKGVPNHPLGASGFIAAATGFKIEDTIPRFNELLNKLPVKQKILFQKAFDSSDNEKSNGPMREFSAKLKEETTSEKLKKEIDSFNKIFNLYILMKTESPPNSQINENYQSRSPERELKLRGSLLDYLTKRENNIVKDSLIGSFSGFAEVGTLREKLLDEFTKDYEKLNPAHTTTVQNFLNWLEITYYDVQQEYLYFEADRKKISLPNDEEKNKQLMKEQLNFLLPELNNKIENFYKPAITKKQSLSNIAKSLGDDIIELNKLKDKLTSILTVQKSGKKMWDNSKNKNIKEIFDRSINTNRSKVITIVVEIQDFLRQKINTDRSLPSSYSALQGISPELLRSNPELESVMMGIELVLSRTIEEAKALESTINRALLDDIENISVKDYKSHLDNRANWLKQKLSPNKESGEENENTLLENELKNIQSLAAKLNELTGNNTSSPMKMKELVEKLRAKYKAERQSLVDWKEEILNGLSK